jgi:hypothetical protein
LKRLSQEKHSSLTTWQISEKVSKHCRQMPLDTDSTIDSHLVKKNIWTPFIFYFNKRHYFNFASAIIGTGGLEAHGTA